MQRQADLMEIVGTFQATRRLHRWRQERDEDPNDRDDDQELDEAETVFTQVALSRPGSHISDPAPDTACLRRRGVGGAESYIIHPATNIVHPASGIQHPTTFDQLTTRRRQP